jgi:Fe-S-cluster containining protein
MAYECDQCGACCKFPIIEIDAIDLAREPKLQAVVKPFRHDGLQFDDEEDREEYERVGPLVPGFEAGAMLAVGSAYPCPMIGEGNLCSIYPTRPSCCVAFQAGSRLCQESRAHHGLPALAPLATEASESKGGA